jgi:hypothetical protein
MKSISGAAASDPTMNLFEILARRWKRISDPYRPERHYMRGPGPKCRAKRGLL